MNTVEIISTIEPEEEIHVITYYSANAKPQEQWLAYPIVNGEQWLVRFAADNEAMAIARAKSFLKAERERQRLLKGGEAPASVVVCQNRSIMVSSGSAANSAPVKAAAGWTSAPMKEHKLTGSVWVGNPVTKHKTRIPASDLDAYLNKGYVQAGPRSKF